MPDEIKRQITERARKAQDKKAALGEDIDLSRYSTETEHAVTQVDPADISSDDKERMLSAGIMLDDLSQRSGTFIQKDNSPIHHSASQDGIEVMSTSEALKKYDWLQDYLWKA